MKFGILANTSISDWQIAVDAERMGYDSAWFGDSQMIWSDVYATLALAAHHTSRIRIGPGVSIAGTRLAPVMASAIATINQIAPGRVHLAVGTGHTAMRVMGFEPVKAREFREYIRVLRHLLDGRPVQFAMGDETHEVTHLHRGEGFYDFEHRIPLYVAANGPLACQTAGAYGDGRVCGAEPLRQFERSRNAVARGAEAAGRKLPDAFPHAFLATAMVLRPGETLASDRVIDGIGAEVTSQLHMWWELLIKLGNDDFVPSRCREQWEQYKAYLNGLGMTRDQLHRHVHRGHCTYMVPEERRFVTPEMIRSVSKLIAPADEIMQTVREWELAGLSELVLLCPTASSREVYGEFAREVMARY